MNSYKSHKTTSLVTNKNNTANQHFNIKVYSVCLVLQTLHATEGLLSHFSCMHAVYMTCHKVQGMHVFNSLTEILF